MIPLDMDEPLWHLSKYGCTKRDRVSGLCPFLRSCEAGRYCVGGRIVVEKQLADVDT